VYEVSFLTQSNALADVLGSVGYLVRSITKLSIANVFRAGVRYCPLKICYMY